MTPALASTHPVVTPEQWLVARRELLRKEKELTHLRDEIARQRQALPWTRVEKDYVFDGPQGKETLSDLFRGRSQLIIQHFMFGPGWQEGCVGCSFTADQLEGALLHLKHHDVSFAAVSRAPIAEIDPFKRRMGWQFPWVSSFASDFNYDYHVSFRPEDAERKKVFYNYEVQDFTVEEMSGFSSFYEDASGDIFHTYSCFARGGEMSLAAYFYLELTPKGRNETGPNFSLADWVRHHDKYQSGGHVEPTGRYRAEKASTPCCHNAE